MVLTIWPARLTIFITAFSTPTPVFETSRLIIPFGGFGNLVMNFGIRLGNWLSSGYPVVTKGGRVVWIPSRGVVGLLRVLAIGGAVLGVGLAVVGAGLTVVGAGLVVVGVGLAGVAVPLSLPEIVGPGSVPDPSGELFPLPLAGAFPPEVLSIVTGATVVGGGGVGLPVVVPMVSFT